VDDFRIQKERLAVILTLVGGACLHGYIFVQPAAHGFPGESALRVFNGDEPFFPIQLEGGEVILVAKDRVAEVLWSALPAEDDVRLQSAGRMRLDVTLAGGSARSGLVLVEMPSQRARPLDFLNQHDQRFLTLYDDEGVRLLNLRQIDSVRSPD
jgi:hypothetical protein